MGVVVLLIAVVAVAFLICIALNTKTRAAQARLHGELANRSLIEEKLATARKELSAAKEELSKKAKLLDEAREIGRKKVKKEAIQAGREQEVENAQSNVELERLKRALQAMEAQLHAFQSDAERQVTLARDEAKSHFEQQLQSGRDEIKRLEAQLGKRQHETSKKKQGLEQSLPTIDVAAWSDDTVNEVARLLRKAEQLEKMNGVTHGKLQMAQERFSELQRRYFAVCRELALAVGKEPEMSDEQARDVAESIAS